MNERMNERLYSHAISCFTFKLQSSHTIRPVSPPVHASGFVFPRFRLQLLVGISSSALSSRRARNDIRVDELEHQHNN
jgi:hypothetical protein